MKWLITGGCGFIGRGLITALGADGSHSIRIVDNLSVGSREDLATAAEFSETGLADLGPMADSGAELVVADILDADAALRIAAGADTIVHLAANTGVAPSVEDPRSDCVTNVMGTLNYLEAARHNNVSRFVFASSGAPVGECEPPIHEELAAHPVSPYGASKLAGEGYCSAYFRTYGVETVALRFGNVYGPGSSRKSSVVALFIRRAMAGDVLTIYGDGSQTRDFIYLGDLLGAIIKAATTPGIGGETFQIATNRETSVNEMVEQLVPVLEAAGISGIKIENASPRVGDVMRNFSDTSKALNILGWEAVTSLPEGLHNTVEDLRG